MNRKLSSLLAIGSCLTAPMLLTQNAMAQSCAASIQLTDYTPAVCYYDFDEQSCVDSCSAADPQFQSSCFTEVELPCDIKNDLYTTAAGFQQRGSYSWVHISDLLSFEALRSDLHIIQQENYQTLYENFLIFPTNDVFSEANQQIKKENFRLHMFDESKRVTSPLNEAGLFRRLSLGRSLEGEVNDELTDINNKINLFPLFNSSEKSTLVSEIESIKNSQLLYWNFLARYPANSVAASRVSYLNTKVTQFVNALNELDEVKQAYLLNKAAFLTQSSGVNFRLCQAGGNTVCYDSIVNDDPANFYNGKDQILTYFEETLFLLAKEAEALKLSYDPDLNPGTPGSFPAPDFTGFINDKLTAYNANPSLEALDRLESAINIAFMQQGITGNELFEQLKQSADSHIEGTAFLAKVDNKSPVLCSDYQTLDPQVADIQTEMFNKSNEARDILKTMRDEGRSPELMAQLMAILARINELTALGNRIFSIDRFSDDRNVNVLWRLDPAQLTDFDGDSESVKLEYIALDGMFWIPSMSIQLQQLMPTVEGLATMKGSLLPSASGKISGLRSLQLTLRQSPYASCTQGNEEVKMVVSTKDKNGNTKRHALTAKLYDM